MSLFLLPTGGISGAVSETQKQLEAIQAQETFSGTVSETQRQTESISAQLQFSGTVSELQRQTESIVASETFSGTVTETQSQTELINASQSSGISGSVSELQRQTDVVNAVVLGVAGDYGRKNGIIRGFIRIPVYEKDESPAPVVERSINERIQSPTIPTEVKSDISARIRAINNQAAQVESIVKEITNQSIVLRAEMARFIAERKAEEEYNTRIALLLMAA